jgi:hypothetical protein
MPPHENYADWNERCYKIGFEERLATFDQRVKQRDPHRPLDHGHPSKNASTVRLYDQVWQGPVLLKVSCCIEGSREKPDVSKFCRKESSFLQFRKQLFNNMESRFSICWKAALC